MTSSTSGLQLGALLPNQVIGADIGAARAFAVGVEELGYSHILCYEHVLGAGVGDGLRPDWTGPYTHRDVFHEPLVLYAYLAAVTSRLEFTTGVMVLPQRQTALLAKQAAELALVSDGRFRLGVGIGWNEVEFESLGVPYRRRAARYEEQLGLLRRLWTEPIVDHRGTFDRIPSAGLNPLPPAPVPLWLGSGDAEPALDRVARLADGWVPSKRTAAEAAPALDRLRELRTAAGGPPLGIQARLVVADMPAAEWGDQVRAWSDVDATHLTVSALRMGLDTVDDYLRFHEKFLAEHV